MKLAIIAAVVAFFALDLAGCASHPKIGEAKEQYIYATVCSKQQQCLGDLFKTAYPGGYSECMSKAKSVDPQANSEDLSACTDKEWETCRDEWQAGACPSDPNAGGIPPKPASCNKC